MSRVIISNLACWLAILIPPLLASDDTEVLQRMIDQTNAHDTMYLEAGVYRAKNIKIDKPIALIGRGDCTILASDGEEIMVVTSDSVSVVGLHLEGVETDYLKERAAIRVYNAKSFHIADNEIINCFFGVYLERSSQGIVKNNYIEAQIKSEASSGNGIHAWHCHSLEIADNEIIGHRDGIYFEFVENSSIQDNLSHSNLRYGLHFMFSNHDSYIGNTFSQNGAGVAVMFSHHIDMSENVFSFNWGQAAYGLLLKEVNDAEIYDNTFEQNTTGIFVEGCNRIIYQHNTLKRNGWAIKFSGGCSLNEITENDFLNNALELVVNTSLSDNSFHHNYWSNYAGYDLDRDGVGDVPHYPVKLFSYVLEKAPEAIVLMRSLFVDILNFSERVSPVFTPKEVVDPHPLMQQKLW